MALVSDARMMAEYVLDMEQDKKDAKRREIDQKRSFQRRLQELGSSGANMLGGAAVGFWRGHKEEADGTLPFLGTGLPPDLLLGAAGYLATFASQKEDSWGRALGFGLFNGMLAASTAAYFRNHAARGRARGEWWDGIPELMGRQTHNHPSIGALPPATIPTVSQSMTDAELADSLRRSF